MTTARMRFCLQAVTSLTARDLDDLTASIEAYRANGMGDRESERAAVSDLAEQITAERAEIEALVAGKEQSAPNPEVAQTKPKADKALIRPYRRDDGSVGYEAVPIVEPEKTPSTPSANTIFTQDAADAARARLKAKLGRLQSGIDPETMMDGIILAGYHIEKGARTFAAFARAMVDDLGDAVKPYLQSWYMAVRADPRMVGMKSEMDKASVVEDIDVDAILAAPEAKVEVGGDKADTSPKEAPDDTQGNGTDDAEPLEPQLPSGNPELAEGVAPETSASERQPDAAGNGRAGGGRAGRKTGMGRGAKPVQPKAPAEIRPTGRSPVAGEPDAQNQLPGPASGNFEITDKDGIGQGTDGQKLRANMEAIRTLRRIQKDNRNATLEEQATMARFVGWGGLRPLIDPNTTGKQWLDARAELLGTSGQEPLLVDGAKGSEWASLQRSITAAHFTAPAIGAAMWDVVRHFGFTGGRVLEPTPGIGTFIGVQPADLAASSEWHGSELDIITGQMAKLIYPEAAISAGIGFEDVPFAKSAFTLAIGNPPFGSLTLSSSVPAYKDIPKMKIHNFILAKTGEHLQPGGLMAMVVTHRFLDTANPEAREHLAKTFKFIGAFRLPNDAFLKNAGTEVTTDVVFLQKLHVGEKAADLSWLDTEGSIRVDGQDIRVNRYYQNNPDNILGRSATDGTMYGPRKAGESQGEYTVHSDGRDLKVAIAYLLKNQWADLKDIAKLTNSDISAAAVMMQQSDLAVGGVMLDANGKLLRRELDDSDGNAVVVEVTPNAVWREGGEKWARLLDVFERIKVSGRMHSIPGFESAVSVAYSAKGEERPKPTKAEKAVYDIHDGVDKAGSWRFDSQLDTIRAAVQRSWLGDNGLARLKGLVGLRNTALQLIEAERADKTAQMKTLRERLNTEYDAFVAAHGLVNDPANAGLLDGDIGVESGLESGYRAKNGTVKSSATKSDIFSRRVNFPYQEVTSAKDAADGLQVSMAERGRLDIQYIAKLTGQSSKEVIAELSGGERPLIFLDPDTSEYTDADQYLSGNVKVKLQKAKDAGLRANEAALEAIQPAPKTRSNVRPSIRGAWMPESVFVDFLKQLGANNVKVSIIESQGLILGSGSGIQANEFGAQFVNTNKDVFDIFNSAASGKPLTVWSSDAAGNRIKNQPATKDVNLLVERMTKVFEEWAWSEESRVQLVVDAFNEKMNTHVARQYDGNKYLRLAGASPSIELRTTQKNAAWRIVQAQTVLLDHVVGAGKTFTIITGAMQRRRLGLSRKPMIVVPNHLVTQWARDFYALYPGAKIMAATPDDFARNRRRRLFARIATGDFDAVIIGHSSLSFIETPVEDQAIVINEQIRELNEVLNELKAKKESGRTLTQIQEKLQKYEGKLAELQDVRRDEIGIDFANMGVDYLAVDEMHEFKNLEYSTAGERVVGMNDPKGAKKSFDLYVKTRGVLERGGAVTGATGTPVSNSLVEIYTMMKYLAHKDLIERNQMNFDAWSGAYARTDVKLEYTATQKLKPRRVLAGLNNLSALKQLYEQFADYIGMADLKRIHAEDIRRKNLANGTNLREGFPVPKVTGGGRVLESGPITEAQSAYMDYLVARMQAIEGNKSNKEYKRIDNPLWVLTDARKMSLDIRIVDPTAPRDENGKVMRAATKIVQTYKQWDADSGTQLVFCDLSTPSKNAVKEARSLVRDATKKLFGEGAEGKRVLARVTQPDTYVEQWRVLEELAHEVIESDNTDPEIADQMQEYLSSLDDVDATMSTADVGFSVYDDMRQVLMDKGIPSSEIAFIHDYNTPEQKAKLFADVNDGNIRVLMGSSAKMGAGTNAQRRLVALHHMDAPWRPSDVEQREGRIIRQGNTLFERDPEGFRVDISAYSTAGTSDAVMWQVLERKARSIEEFRSSDMDSTDEEGSDSNQYAEFMAQSTGNPVFRLKLEAERTVDVLDTDSRGALLARQSAQAFMRTYETNVKQAEAMRNYGVSADVSAVEVAGEKGTAKELEAVLADVKAKHEKAYADYLPRKAAGEAALDAWKALPEAERGEKPPLPAAPGLPSLLSKSVQDESGYARAIKAALSRATQAGFKFELGNMKASVRPSYARDESWVLDLWDGTTYVWHVHANAKSADASPKLAMSLTPEALLKAADYFASEGARKLATLKADYDAKAKVATMDINTSKLRQAQDVMEWMRTQVAFAEQQADIRRGQRPNRFIAKDTRRPLSASRAVAGEQRGVEFGDESFETTGFVDGIYHQAVGEDGREVLLRIPRSRNGPFEVDSVVEKPAGVEFSGLMSPGKARVAASTNVSQTGEAAANETDVLFSLAEPPFYSELARMVEKVPMNAAPSASWKMWLKGLPAKGVKPDEIEWTGINEWLDLQPGKITKAQVQQYLDANGVQVTETVLGEAKRVPEDDFEEARARLEADGFTLEQDDVGVFIYRNGALVEDYASLTERQREDYELMREAEADDTPARPRGADETKYGQYQLPGGTNYREVLLTLPERPSKQFEDWLQSQGFSLGGTESEANLREAWRQETKQGDKPYRSGHWDQLNVLAHIRLNDRTDADGKRVLLVEEIQSDWGQAGKKAGFAQANRPAYVPTVQPGERDSLISLMRKLTQDKFIENGLDALMAKNIADRSGHDQLAGLSGKQAEYDDLIARETVDSDETNRRRHTQSIPAAPFVTNTDKWLALALKRVVKMAVDGGYDKVAFVNGEQSAARYDLSKQVEQITAYEVAADGLREVTIEAKNGPKIKVFPDKSGAIATGDYAGKGLDDVIGKDLAAKVLDNPKMHKLRDLDLKVGGEGMKAFYDKIVPSALKDVLRKVGGGAMSSVQFSGKEYRLEKNGESGGYKVQSRLTPTDGWNTDVFASTKALAEADLADLQKLQVKAQPGFAITPAMREKAARGLPLFDASTLAKPGAAPDTSAYGTASKLDTDAAARLAAGINQERAPGRANVVLDAVAPRADGKGNRWAALQAVVTIAKRLFGHRVVFVKFTGASLFNGVVDASQPGVIFINVDSKRPLMAVLGHELLHKLSQNNPLLYADFNRRITKLIKNYPAYLAKIKKAYAAHGLAVPKEISEELHGDIVGDFFDEQQFWADMAKDQPVMFKRVAQAILKFLGNVSARLLGVSAYGTENYLKDIDAARAAVVGAMQAYSQSQTGDMADEVGGIRLSVSDRLDTLNQRRGQPSPAEVRAAKKAFDNIGARTPLFSIADTIGRLSSINQQTVRNTFADMIGDAGAKVSWLDKTLKTQYAKAEKFPAFKAVFERVQSYIEDISTLTNQAADLAPSILPKLQTWKDLRQSFKQYGMSDADAAALARPVFQGTLTDKKVYSDAELEVDFDLTPKQITSYREFYAAVNESLDQVVAVDVLKLLGDKNPALRHLAVSDRAAMRDGIREYLTRQIAETSGAERAAARQMRKDVEAKYQHIDKMKAEGYAPLMRFGKYKVYIAGKEGESLFFGLYESKTEANKMARELAADPDFAGLEIERGVLSQEQYKLFSALPLDSLEVFAEAVGADQKEIYQQYLRLAKNNRSALKRLIQRKGTAGFSEDVPRVLANFVMSNSRLAASGLNLPQANLEIQNMREGDVKDEAIALVESAQNPTETAAGARALMFVNFIGGSIASAAINLTQPVTMTLPYLSQFGGLGKATARLMSAANMVATGNVVDPELQAALKQAEDDGTVSPQEIHHLQAQAMNTWGTSALAKQAAFIWGAPFSLAEQFNRRVSFVAAYVTAQEQGIADPFAFAERAVTETQGLYNKGNRPNVSRSALGATALQFKQFSIHYLEWIKRMWTAGKPGSDERRAGQRAVLIALALLMVAGGSDGIPFAEDISDLVDTIGQALGYNTNSKRIRRNFVAKTLGLGDMTADVVARGLSAIPGMPMDVSLRMGMGNLVPGTGLFLRSNTDRSRDLLEFAGAAGGLAKQYMDAGEKALAGDPLGGIEKAMPMAIQNLGKAIRMWQSGEARDEKGNKVMATDVMDGAMRFLGFNPAALARESEKLGMLRRSEQLAKNVEGDIAAKWARGFADGDKEAVREARAELQAWNRDNPEDRIVISNGQILRRVKLLRKDRAARFITSTSPERRARVREAILEEAD